MQFDKIFYHFGMAYFFGPPELTLLHSLIVIYLLINKTQHEFLQKKTSRMDKADRNCT